jgi:hypothetical protein
MRVFTSVKSGELAGSATALQLPNISCAAVKFRAESANVGKVYIGGAGVTVPEGTTDVTSGMEIAAGVETGWFPVFNLNVFYRICDNAGDDLVYIALG